MSQETAEATDTPVEQPLFSELGLSEPVLQAVTEAGYLHPTTIQELAIPALLSGKDLVGSSQTGTGKTAAFTLPTLVRLGEHDDGPPRCLVLEPTRELALQVDEAIKKYGKNTNLRTALLYGGVKYGKQRDEIDANPDIVIATPGRLIDFVDNREISLKNLEILVLDEADRMLDMGFMPAVQRILDFCGKNEKRQSLLFSATIPDAIQRLSDRMLRDPLNISVGGGKSTAETISHAIYPVDERQKFDLLQLLLKKLDYHSVIIFSRTKVGADIIARWLDNGELEGKIAVLHSDRPQGERAQSLKGFKEGKYEILVATDIVARGIDISDVSHVINYDIPQHPEDYVHRIGRTGRAKKEGDAVTLYTATETEFLAAIERFIGKPIERKRLDNFDYNWSPVLDENAKRRKKKRNRGGDGGLPKFRRKR